MMVREERSRAMRHDWMAKYPRVQALLARPDDVLDDGPADERDDNPDTLTSESCGCCGAALTHREVEVNRTRLPPIFTPPVSGGWPFRFTPKCARCLHED
jgi:hypothetical protein